MTPTPESTNRWLGTIMPVLREGSAVLSLFMLIIGLLVVYWLLDALHNQQSLTRQVVERLLTCTEQRGELLGKFHSRRD